MTSWILPGAISRTRGLPMASVNAWIAVVRPPRERPMVSSKVPLFRHRDIFMSKAGLLQRSRWGKVAMTALRCAAWRRSVHNCAKEEIERKMALRRKTGFALGCWEITSPGDYVVTLDESHSSPTQPFIDILQHNPDTGHLNHSITLHLRGRATSAVGADTKASFLRCNGVDGVNILGEGMAIDGFKKVVMMRNCNWTVVQNLATTRAYTSGIDHSGDFLMVKGCVIRNIGPPSDRPDFSFGLRSSAGIRQIIVDNVFDNIFHPTREAVGISLDGGTDVALISGNRLLNPSIADPVRIGGNMGGPGSYAVWLGHAAGANEDVQLVGNVMRNWACCYGGAEDVGGYIDNTEIGYNIKSKLNSANWQGPDA